MNMRGRSLHLTFFAALALVCPAAFAHPSRTAHRAAAANSMVRTPAHALTRQAARAASARHERREAGRDHARLAQASERRRASHLQGERKSHHLAEPARVARADAPVPASEPAGQPLPDIHHDRHIHLSPAPQSPAPMAQVGSSPGTAMVMPALYTRSGRLIVPPALKGSHEILVHQNEMADRDGLVRVQDDADLDRLRAQGALVALPSSGMLLVDERLPLNRRSCRPWTAQFLAALARAHYARFHTPLQVNSAVRTVEFQERLRFTNGNAAPAEGETASPHLTGQAVDLAKHGLSMTEIAWLRGYLMPLVQEGKVDVEEEFQQACFHISVYRNYVPQAAPQRVIPDHRGPATALAAAVR